MEPFAPLSKDIAVIGMSCRFPGNVSTPEAYWELLINKVDAIEDVPKERWDFSKFYDPEKNTKRKMYTRQGGWLSDVDKFDNVFFKISPLETESLDPQVRIMLELSYEAFENAGIDIARLKGSSTGVFVGLTIVDYIEKDIRSANLDSINAYSVMGTQMSSASGRISYAFGLEGPSMSLDTACSSSLTAVHLACQSLISGESSLALAGGVNLILSPKYHIAFCELNALSDDCRSRAFDASASGFVRSEGAGTILLKRLTDARRDNDNILAVICGSGITNDGMSKGYTVPRMEPQAKAMRMAMEMAGVQPDDIDYFETHGTGTPVGDPIEMEGIVSVFKDRAAPNKLYAGSAKTNIGHCESAAGMAGLLKSILALRHHLIPPNLHFNTPNPAIKWDAIPVTVPTTAIDWSPSERPRYASVSGFGLSGTNVNIVLREGDIGGPSRDRQVIDKETFMLPISAASGTALRTLIGSYTELLIASPGDEWKEICVAAALHRSHLGCRHIACGSSRYEIVTELETWLANDKAVRNNASDKKVVFVFPGQGAQWIGMGRELVEKEEAFRAKMIECDEAISRYADWSLLAEIKRDAPDNRFHEVDVIQPILFAIEVSLASLWQSWGVMPDIVLGHSMGEVAAAHVAGVLSIEDAAAIICKRSALAKTTSGEGAMALIELSYQDALRFLEGCEESVSIGACNGPVSTVISGDTRQVEKLLARLTEEGIFSRLIKVDYASHSPQMDKLKIRLLEELSTIQPQKGSIPIYSTVINDRIDGRKMDARYWSDNLRKPVLFAQAVATQLDADDCVFIEVSPHPILLQLVDQAIEHYGKLSSVAVFSTKREDVERDTLLNNFKSLYLAGVSVDWATYYKGLKVRHQQLPAYPWQKDRFWIDTVQHSRTTQTGDGSHPFLYKETIFADDKNSILWEGVLDLGAHRFLEDHKVKDTVIFPAAGYIDLMLTAVRRSYGSGSHRILDISFQQPLTLDQRVRNIQVILKKQRSNCVSIEIFSAPDGETAPAWEFNCKGEALLFTDAPAPAMMDDLAEVAGYPRHFTREEHYAAMGRAGISYGERFQAVQDIWAKEGVVVGKITVPGKIRDFINVYEVHPALLDACFQVSVASVNLKQHSGEAFLPYSIDSIDLRQDGRLGVRTDGALWVRIRDAGNQQQPADSFSRDIEIGDEQGNLIISIVGFTCRRLKEQARHSLQNAYYAFEWKAITPELPGTAAPSPRTILVFEEAGFISSVMQWPADRQGMTIVSIQPGYEYSLSEGPTPGGSLPPNKKAQFIRLLNELIERKILFTDVVFAWGLSSTTIEDWRGRNVEMDFIYLVQALSETRPENFKRLMLITVGAHQVLEKERVNVFNAPLLGIARVAAHEHAEFNCTRIDLGTGSPPEPDLIKNILLNDVSEREYAIRGKALYVPRVAHLDTTAILDRSRQEKKMVPLRDEMIYRFVTSEPGILDHISVKEVAREQPLPDEIEVEVKAVGLNFMNVMSALGIYPGSPKGFLCLGVEFSGVVRTVGNEVTTLAPGDRVIGLSPIHDCLGRLAICKALQAVMIPDHLDFTDAATLAVAYGTAYICLIARGDLKKGERVLIHSATGGVGLAAIEVARQAGAEIFATAGSEEKRSLLRRMGVKYVMDSHSLDFGEEIRRYTNGEGIDMVLNSLSGEAMYQSMKLLRGLGRFLEIGKKDIYENSNLKMDIFREGISYTFFDLHKMMNERPDLVNKHLKAVMDHFYRGDYNPIPKTLFNAARVLDGFDLMTRGQHTGKIVFDLQDTDGLLVEPNDSLFNEQETYLITGGMGGLGFYLAEWMCGKGAKNIVLSGRSLPDEKRQRDIEALRSKGKNIIVLTADISKASQVEDILQTIRSSLPPLAGIFHAAGSLSDSSLANLDDVLYQVPIGPKIYGAWNLHRATAGDNLKYFVLYSSAASSLGSIGQANYVAGNAFLDALSKERQAAGQPVTCINWGPVAEIGLAAQDDLRGQRLQEEGIASLTQEEYTAALEFVFTNQLTDINILHLNYDKWVDHNPTYAIDRLLSNLAGNGGAPAENSFVKELKACPSADKAGLLMQASLKEILGTILKSPPGRIDVDLPFINLGLDSLMAIQFRNKLQKLVGLSISVTVFWRYSKVRALSDFLLKELGITRSGQDVAQGPGTGAVDVLIDNMSEEEMLGALDCELHTISIRKEA